MKSNLNGVILSDFKQDLSLVFVDMSFYNPSVSILQPILSVTRPYFSFPIDIPYTPNGLTNLSSVSLQFSQTPQTLPCGLYKITQSICPADKMYNVFYYVHLGGAKLNAATLRCQNKIAEAVILDDKIRTLEALTYCKDEKKILAMLKTMPCGIQTDCSPIINVQPINVVPPIKIDRLPCSNC